MEESARAAKAQREELNVYRRADIVLAVSEAEKRYLEHFKLKTRLEVVPLIHKPAKVLGEVTSRLECDMVFVGNFEHTANGDAMVYFCSEVFPIIKKDIPHARLRIVGNAPPSEVKRLAGGGVEVLGYVPELQDVYELSNIAIAPLTWGAGLKGKIAGAMAAGLPVVTTSVGIDGFDLSPGKNVLVGDTPKQFADAVNRLWQDNKLYQTIRTNGWEFIRDHYSIGPVTSHISELFRNLEQYSVKRLSLAKRVRRAVPVLLERHLLWRFQQQRRNSV